MESGDEWMKESNTSLGLKSISLALATVLLLSVPAQGSLIANAEQEKTTSTEEPEKPEVKGIAILKNLRHSTLLLVKNTGEEVMSSLTINTGQGSIESVRGLGHTAGFWQINRIDDDSIELKSILPLAPSKHMILLMVWKERPEIDGKATVEFSSLQAKEGEAKEIELSPAQAKLRIGKIISVVPKPIAKPTPAPVPLPPGATAPPTTPSVSEPCIFDLEELKAAGKIKDIKKVKDPEITPPQLKEKLLKKDLFDVGMIKKLDEPTPIDPTLAVSTTSVVMKDLTPELCESVKDGQVTENEETGMMKSLQDNYGGKSWSKEITHRVCIVFNYFTGKCAEYGSLRYKYTISLGKLTFIREPGEGYCFDFDGQFRAEKVGGDLNKYLRSLGWKPQVSTSGEIAFCFKVGFAVYTFRPYAVMTPAGIPVPILSPAMCFEDIDIRKFDLGNVSTVFEEGFVKLMETIFDWLLESQVNLVVEGPGGEFEHMLISERKLCVGTVPPPITIAPIPYTSDVGGIVLYCTSLRDCEVNEKMAAKIACALLFGHDPAKETAETVIDSVFGVGCGYVVEKAIEAGK